MPYETLEFATTMIRRADRRFLLMQIDFPTPDRALGASSQSVRLILGTGAVPDGPSDGLNRNRAVVGWRSESAKLCDSMFRNFAAPGRSEVVFTNPQVAIGAVSKEYARC